jgi:hypothetical protein
MHLIYSLVKAWVKASDYNCAAYPEIYASGKAVEKLKVLSTISRRFFLYKYRHQGIGREVVEREL